MYNLKYKIMKKSIFIAFLALASQVNAQISMSPDGEIGMGTNKHSTEFKCRIKGNLLLTGFSDKDGTISEPTLNGDTVNINKGDLPYVYTGPIEMVFKIDELVQPLPPEAKKGKIGVSNGHIHFYHNTYGYNEIHSKAFHLASDETIKEDIIPIENPMNVIRQLKGYSYFFKESIILGQDEEGEEGEEDDEPQLIEPKRSYGFLAQEVEDFLPDIVEQGIDIKMIDYNSIIPFITEAVKEQQIAIERLQDYEHNYPELDLLQAQIIEQQIINEQQQAEIDMLKARMMMQQENNEMQQNQINWLIEKVLMLMQRLEIPLTGDNFPPHETGKKEEPNEYIIKVKDGNYTNAIKLFDNVPNPFDLKTEIKFEIPAEITSAKIIITDMQGVEIKTFNITQRGLGSVEINGSELKPGVYLYSLVIDGKTVDTKRMILTK